MLFAIALFLVAFYILLLIVTQRLQPDTLSPPPDALLFTSHDPSQDTSTLSLQDVPSQSKHQYKYQCHRSDDACTITDQYATVHAIERAVAEAKFRRWGEEQGWGGSRMEFEMEGFRRGLVGRWGEKGF